MTLEDIEKSNKVKILIELQQNARASLSELAEKTGLTRHTVKKTISIMEKKKEIWGYTAIFDSKLLGKKPFIFLFNLDMSINIEDFLKKVTDEKLINNHAKIFGVNTSMFLHGKKDILALIWTEDIIEAKKLLNKYKNVLKNYLHDIELIEVITTFRNNGIENPNMIQEWKNLLL